MNGDMQVAECLGYGGPENVVIRTRPRPQPAPGQVVIRVLASTVSTADARIRGMNMPPGFGMMARLAFGIRRPRNPVLGTELCGEVVALGAGVTTFAHGDCVVAMTGARGGAHAEYCALPASGAIIHKPARLSLHEAAAMGFGGTAALVYLRDKARLQPGERVLVLGAGGTVGSAAVQIAHAMGAEVTAQARESRHATLRALGADHVIDRKQQDFAVMGQRWDVIFDSVGATTPAAARTGLPHGGRLLLLAGSLGDTLRAVLPGRRPRIMAGPAPERAADLVELARLVEAGKYRPLIDSRFPLSQIAAAHARVDSQDKHGSVVVTMGRFAGGG
jgi:NADPH:quinone reductase-like Zn-dependent oxidoreductase